MFLEELGNKLRFAIVGWYRMEALMADKTQDKTSDAARTGKDADKKTRRTREKGRTGRKRCRPEGSLP